MDHKKDIIQAHELIQAYIHRTAVLSSSQLNTICGCELYFKCENFQRMGAFKIRGATHAILRLTEEERNRGVVTHSSGNMAQAVALAAKSLNIPAYIVMPKDAPQVKVNAVKDYGGQITFCQATIEDRTKTANEIIAKTQATFIHPFDNINVILGQATAAKELLEQVNDLNIIVAPVGGGGLISGTGLSAKYFGNNCKVVGAEPEIVDDAFRSFRSGKVEKNESINTIADGLKTNLSELTLSFILKYLDQIFTVSESEIIHAMQLVFERMKIVIEPSAAVVLAAVIQQPDYFRNKKVGLIISGGNVDMATLPFKSKS